jgi:transposase-like protein
MTMTYCPNCKTTVQQVKAGKNASGSQRYRCKICDKKYTPRQAPPHYSPVFREQAVRMYLSGMSFRAIARALRVNHQTVINWIEAHAYQTSLSRPRSLHRKTWQFPEKP